MTDVRLTATNPEDSSVVPVACNAKGELKLEEVPIFDGDLQGDLTVSGNATFIGSVETGTFVATRGDSARTPVLETSASGNVVIGDSGQIVFANGGSASFGSTITSGPSTTPIDDRAHYLSIGAEPFSVGSATNLIQAYYSTDNISKYSIFADGSATFAGNKAGFTAEGYLWCTTRRGDTVILDFTSNGMATWAPYTPPNRLTELQDRWSEKNVNRPAPQESSQDEPETPQ